MKKILLFICILYAINSNAQDWKTIQLDSTASVNFPAEPSKQFKEGQWAFAYNDSLLIYAAVQIDVSNMPKRPSDRVELSKFYLGNIKGTLNASGGVLIDKNYITISGEPGIGFTIKIPNTQPGAPNYIYTRLLLHNTKLYSFTILTMEDNQELIKDEAQLFFESISVKQTVSSKTQVDKPQESAAFNFGYLIGQLLFYALIAGGLVFLIIFIVRKSK
jgi:hypothetical protein